MTHTPELRAERRRVALATVVGTTIEWYDFFIYATCAGLVFGPLFFSSSGGSGSTLFAFATVSVSFFFRPVGAALAGHFGDRVGRKRMLVVTLIGMGAATTLIGLLPTAATIGIAAPILLVALRILQGLSAGGEWGGAVLMAVESAPEGHRGRYGAFPQIGVPLGLLLSSGVLTIITRWLGPDAFLAWGWRIPFLLSIVLVFVGHVVRTHVDESPVFREIAELEARTSIPLLTLVRRHLGLVLLAAVTLAGNTVGGYLTTGGFIQNYATDPNGQLRLPQDQVLLAVTASGAVWLAATWCAGILSDHIGRRNTSIIGFIALFGLTFVLFPLVNSGSVVLLGLGLCLFAVGLGFTYGQVAANFAELFPASVRYSGVSVSYALGTIVGGLTPLVAEALRTATGTVWAVAWYVAAVVVVALIAVLLLRDRTNIPLDPEHEALQAESAIFGVHTAHHHAASGS